MMIDTQNGYEFAPASGLYEGTDSDGHRIISNIRQIGGKVKEARAKRAAGTLPIWAATWLIAAVGAVAMFVSLSAQRQYILNVRHVSSVAWAEALLPDLMLAVVTLLALGLSLAGKSSRTERFLILASAAVSGFMNLSDGGFMPRIAKPVTFLLASVVFAVAVDRVVSVIRRHRLGEAETSPWTAMGGAVVILGKFLGVLCLYSLRTALAPGETVGGLRRLVLAAAPVPGKPVEVPAAIEAPEVPATEVPEETEVTDHDARVVKAFLEASGHCGEQYSPGLFCTNLKPCPDHGEPVTYVSKKAHFLSLYKAHSSYGDRSAASRVATELAPQAGLQAGTGRTYIAAELDRLADGASKEN